MKKLLFIMAMMLMSFTSKAQDNVLGDVNKDGAVSIADAMMVIDIIINGYSPFSVSPAEVTMSVGNIATATIAGGYNNYDVTTANASIVKASLDGKTITLTAIANGKTTVTIKDVQTNRRKEIAVVVSDKIMKLSTTSVTLTEGKQVLVSILSGSGSYTVQSNDLNVATASLDGTKIKVGAVGEGSTSIVVTDVESGQTVTLDVIVNAKPIIPFTICTDDHHPHFIDLGLPSGTLWSCCNVGASSPEGYGGYYAWGETEEKDYYSFETYQYGYHEDDSWTYYWTLNDRISGTKYDVAHVKWGGFWQMMSVEQTEELVNNCIFEYTTLNGINGARLTGPNGGSIFLPAAGTRSGNTFYNKGSNGYYWSDTPDDFVDEDDVMYTYNLYFNNTQVSAETAWRDSGYPVRPIYQPLALSTHILNLAADEQATVSVNSGSGNYDLNMSTGGVVTTAMEGSSIIFTAIGEGTTTITVTDTKSGQIGIIKVIVSNEQLMLSDSSLDLIVGDEGMVDIISGSGNYSVKSNNARVATANVSGGTISVTAVREGNAIITVTDTYLSQTATIIVTVSKDMREAYAVLTGSTLTFYFNANKPYDAYAMNSGTSAPGWNSKATTVTKVVFDASYANARPKSCRQWFYGMTNLTTITGSGNLNTSETTDMYAMFYNCSALTGVSVGQWKTSKVKNMQSMFYNCSKLTSLDIEGWDTSNVTNMANMFCACAGLNGLNLSGWNTAKVTSMANMFTSCTSLATLSVKGWNTANVTDFSYMFYNLPLKSLDLSSFSIASTSVATTAMLNIKNLTSLSISSSFKNLNSTACQGTGTKTGPCALSYPSGFIPEKTSSGNGWYQWKGGNFKDGI